jgi:hypothetical protein
MRKFSDGLHKPQRRVLPFACIVNADAFGRLDFDAAGSIARHE